MDRLKGKRIAVFASGASPYRESVIKEVTEKNFTPQMMEQIRFFYLRGGFDFDKLKPVDKVLMTLLKMKMKRKKKEDLLPDEVGMLAAYAHPADFTNRDKIGELALYVRTGQ